MLVHVKYDTHVDRRGRLWKYRTFVVSCDQCSTEFVYKRTILRRLQFCSKDCTKQSRIDGLLKAAREATCLERFGVSTPLISEECLEKGRQTCLSLYGVDHSSKSEVHKLSRQNTCMEKYGSKSALGSEEVRSKFNQQEISQKKHETRKKNNSFKKSGPEDKCYEKLCEEFGKENICRQVLMNDRWPIDFYIPSIDLCIQFDGLYWHGLDRSLEEIKKFSTETDKVIYRKMMTDVEQNAWFKDQGKSFVRIREDEDIDAVVSSLKNVYLSHVRNS